MLAVCFRVFLHCVISQMDHAIFKILGGELFGSCADISFFVPIASKVAVDAGDEHVASNVKLSLVV